MISKKSITPNIEYFQNNIIWKFNGVVHGDCQNGEANTIKICIGQNYENDLDTAQKILHCIVVLIRYYIVS